MLKLQEKLRKAIGGIIAILFIVSSIIIAYILIDFGLRAQQEQIEMQRKTYETQVKATDIAKAISGMWSYGGLEDVLTCLLYTSPSPRDKRQSRMPSSA